MKESQSSLFALPEEPIDGYRLKWFLISVSPRWWYLYEIVAVYHIDIPYKGGPPLRDQWMVYENNSAKGRGNGWKYPERESDYWKDAFLTKEEALVETRRRLERMLASNKEEITRIEEMIIEIRVQEEK